MNEFWQQTFGELPKAVDVLTVSYRLLAALILASLLGLNRERMHESAGLRTHLLVAISAALFVILISQEDQAQAGDVSRVIQGVAAGIGFVGGGAILKSEKENKAHGLATATSIWLAAAIGVCCGNGRVWKAAIAAMLGWIVLAFIKSLERHAPVPDPLQKPKDFVD